jgi:hypothetical protein
VSKAHKHCSHPIRSAENDEACNAFKLRAVTILANDRPGVGVQAVELPASQHLKHRGGRRQLVPSCLLAAPTAG